ncbi:MAG TPA: PRC and DUF2382 domain-containing protein [Intrasporangium sp.]|uniref:PRC and DUF2382 domain-containing protein n=1 Tax=Intrasporangium sp. TaxID=1925024 RepID=UPI002D788139|nr:PRC and DUF2382 domain-containing protein [Intrasporangium sp.]HET7397877.1 PRC and DUF2382 domain-containing protein [Intrasporangium sp.]
MSIDRNQLTEVIGGTVYGSDGDKIGQVGQVYLDDVTDQPEWVTVQTGLFGTKETFIPIAEAQFDNGDVRVPFDKSKVKGAPNVDAEQGHLSREEEEELYRYYGLDYSRQTSDSDGADDVDTTRTAGLTDPTAGRDAASEGYDTSGPTTDDAMTVSEERLEVGTQSREAGRARLRKYVVTEQQNVTVPVSREEVRVEREPITDANVGAAMSGPDISEEEHEVVLREERPVVAKETVPVERVKLSKDTVTENVEVSEDVRKERVETDGIETDRNTGDDRR